MQHKLATSQFETAVHQAVCLGRYFGLAFTQVELLTTHDLAAHLILNKVGDHDQAIQLRRHFKNGGRN